MKKRNEPKGIRDDLDREREHEATSSGKDRNLSREDKAVPRDRVKRYRAGEGKGEILKKGNWEKPSFRNEGRKHSDSKSRNLSREDKGEPSSSGVKRFRAGEVRGGILKEGNFKKECFREEDRRYDGRPRVRDAKQSWELGNEVGNGKKSDVHGRGALGKIRSSRHLRYRHSSVNRTQSQNDRLFKTNVEYNERLFSHVHRQHSTGGTYRPEKRRRRNDDVHRDGHRPGHGVGVDTDFIRDHRRGHLGKKERFINKSRGEDEGQVLFSHSTDDKKSENPDIFVNKKNPELTKRNVKEIDRRGKTDLEGALHESSSSRRCSSKVVIPSQEPEDDGGKVVLSKDEENQEAVFQKGFGNDLENQNDEMKKPLECVNGAMSEEPVPTLVTREKAVHGRTNKHRKAVQQDIDDSSVLPLDVQKSSEEKNWVKICDSADKLRAEGVQGRKRPRSRELKSDHSEKKDDFKRERAVKQKSVDVKREGHERRKTEEVSSRKTEELSSRKTEEVASRKIEEAASRKIEEAASRKIEEAASRKSVEVPQAKVEKQKRVVTKISNDLSLRKQSGKSDKPRDDCGTDLLHHERDHQKHKACSRSASPNTQKRRQSSKERGKSLSPRKFENVKAEWEKFEKERINTLASFDSRYRRFGGGTSGLGGYSPRRRRSEAAIKTPSPPPRSPERRKPRAWDLPPVGLDSSMVAVISAHQAAVQQAVVTLAAVAPLVPASVLVSPVVLPPPVSSSLGTMPSMIPNLLQQVNPAVTAVSLTQATRPLRRLYVGNVPSTVSDGELLEFMNAAMLSANANHLQGTKPCINCSVNVEKSYAFAEFITPEDATAALAFDGVTLHGTILKIRRPKDFVLPANGGPEGASPILDMVSSRVADSPHKVFVGGISSWLTVDKVKEIVTAFGQLKAYHWEVDYKSNPPRPFAFLEYLDPAVTLKACAGLNGLRLGTGYLTVVQATPDADPETVSVSPPFYGIPEHAEPLLEAPTRVLGLYNLVTEDEVVKMSQEEIDGLLEDVRLECARFGNVKSTHIVRHLAHSKLGPHLGNNDTVLLEGENCDLACELQPVYKDNSVAEKDQKPQEVKSDALDEKPSTPLQGKEPGVSAASDIQVIAADFSNDHNEGNEQQECDRRKSRTVTGIGHPEPLLGELNNEWQTNLASNNPSKFASNSLELGETLEQDIAHDPEFSSTNEEFDFSINDCGVLEIGKMYVEFSREESACQAAHALHGRLFAGRKVAVGYLPLKLYQKKFGKGLGPRTFEEKQALALAIQGHLTEHIKD